MYYSGPISGAWLATERFLGRRLMQFGLLTDEALNVIDFDGLANETVSVHTARAAEQGKWWGCVGCRFLSRWVQKNHCQLVTNPNFVMPEGAALRAIVAIFAVLFGTFALPLVMLWALARAVIWLFLHVNL